MTPINTFNGSYDFLSNFYPSPVLFEGMEFPTVEHAYQAAKSLEIRDRRLIWIASTPSKAKRLGKRVHLRPGWEAMKLGIMLTLVREKFTRHPDLREKLLATGNRELIEGNWWNDFFWGVCQGRGENHLGKILMQVRSELRDV